MSRRVTSGTSPGPRDRDASDTAEVYFPGEVVQLLGLQGVTYDTLRRLHRIAWASVTRGTPAPDLNGAWSRYTATDVARLDVLVDLCGGRAALAPDRRLNMRGVPEACGALLELGSTDPLLEVPMARIGSKIVAILDGFAFEPATGQVVLPVAGARPAGQAPVPSPPTAVMAAKKTARLSRRREIELALAAKASLRRQK